MAKRNKNEEVKNEMSIEFLKMCKNDIAKFSFSLREYPKFLISVHAMKDEHTVLQFPNEEMEEYRKLFLQKNERTLEDSMQLDKFKITTSYHDGDVLIRKNTGYFAPRSFWDKIYDYKLT